MAAAAQHSSVHYCAAAKQAHYPLAANKGTIADVREDNYDVRYVKLDISLTNTDASISGNATTRAVTTAAMSAYVTELTIDLTVDSVTVNGIVRPFTHINNLITAGLPAALPAGTPFETRVFYHGTVIPGSTAPERGLRNVISTAVGRPYTFTLGEPYDARDWWPCKQALQDKIDSSDVWIVVDSALKAGSNGLLQRISPVSPAKRRYEWKSTSPIDYYLISAAVGSYDEYAYYLHFNGSTDSMLVQNYIYPNTLSVRKPILDSTGLTIQYFSDLFGRYPWWKEKYGHCQAPLSGGEEHQTMTTIGIWNSDVVPHELAHQWFGDHVTCGTWKDIWLNEGIATYAEYLHVAHFNGAGAARAKIQTIHREAIYENPFSMIPDPTGAVYVDDTTDVGRIFSARLTYNKGGSILHTLRFEADNDTLFFNTLRAYQQQFANSTATTEQFKNLVARQYGRNMDTFFNQWIYASGWPVYNAVWNQKNNLVVIQLDQQATGDYTVNRYSTPLEIKLTGPQGDTTIRIYTNNAATTFYINRGKPVTGIVIDPNDWLLDTPGRITQNSSLGIDGPAASGQSVYPNPVHDFLTIRGAAGSTFQVTDIGGRLLRTQQLRGGSEQIDLRSLAPGSYLYRLNLQGSVLSTGKVVKQ